VGAEDELPKVASASVRCAITSPPYWGAIRYPGTLGREDDPADYVEHLGEICRELKRILTRDGTLWLNIGDVYWGDSPHRDRSWSRRRDATWDRSLTRSRGGSRRSARRLRDLKPKDLVLIPFEIAKRLRADGWYVRADIIWRRVGTAPEPVRDRPSKSFEHIWLFAQARHYYAAFEAYPQWKSAVWDIPVQRRRGLTGTFPEELVRRCLLLGTEPGDTVLDPFAGTGTVGDVAAAHGRKVILIGDHA